jgi:hypothetical protein
MSVAIRPREVATLSARAEFLVVFRVGVLVVAGVWLYLASASATIGTRPGQRNLLPFQALIVDRPADEQRMFRELQEGLLESENIRSTTGAWPDAPALAEQGIPPYAPDPTRRVAYDWQVVKSGVYINYVGVAQTPNAPGWLVLIQEPQAGAPPDPAAEDEDHHKLVNGPMLHVSIWVHSDGRRIAQPSGTASVKLVQMPQAEGWTQLYAKGPSVPGTQPTGT